MGFILYLLVIIIKVTILYLLSFYITTNISDQEKLSTYENGFEPFSELSLNEIQFDIIYWFIGIIYLIFDLELIIIFPFISILYYYTSLLSSIIFLKFILILGLGFIFEIKKKVIDLWN